MYMYLEISTFILNEYYKNFSEIVTSTTYILYYIINPLNKHSVML